MSLPGLRTARALQACTLLERFPKVRETEKENRSTEIQPGKPAHFAWVEFSWLGHDRVGAKKSDFSACPTESFAPCLTRGSRGLQLVQQLRTWVHRLVTNPSTPQTLWSTWHGLSQILRQTSSLAASKMAGMVYQSLLCHRSPPHLGLPRSGLPTNQTNGLGRNFHGSCRETVA